MRLDSSLAFVPYGAPLSLIAASGVAVPSNVIDLLGSGVGTPPANIIGNATVFGEDIGVGGGHPVPMLDVVVGTAFTTGNAATLIVQLQASADTGAPGYTPLSWKTVSQSGEYAASDLTAGKVISRLDFTPTFPDNLNPRFYRLNFVVKAATAFTAGTIAFAIPVYLRDDQANKNAANNYKVQ